MAKQSGSSTSKGNPAHKRMSNDRAKARRARSWVRGQAGKKARAAANRGGPLTTKWQARLDALPKETQTALGMAGPVTPWIIARAERRLRRRPLQEAYGRRHQEDVLSAS